MKTIQLKSISLTNFKGIKSLKIDFEKETSIFGANATGKTTIVDSWSWLLFGKDSTDRTAFEIKTLDKDNNPIPKIDHEVEAVIDVDGEEINLRRTFREKWVKKRGSTEAEFGGNETLYHWNDVPMTLRDYTSKINDLVNEGIFKLITSPTAFNSLKWQDQRQVLIDISGGVTDAEIAEANPEFKELLSKLQNKTLEEYEKQIKSSIRKSKEEIKAIPTRIDEVERGKPEAADFPSIEKKAKETEAKIKTIDGQMTDKLEAQQAILNKKSKLKEDIQKLEFSISDIEHQARLHARKEIRSAGSATDDLRAQISAKDDDLTKAQRTLSSIQKYIVSNQEYIDELKAKNNQIRKDWNERNAEEFKMDDDDCKCPTCKRAFESDDIEAKKKELFANFQQAKMSDLELLSGRGKKNAAAIAETEKEVEALKSRREKGEEIIDSIVEEIKDLEEALETASENKATPKSEDEIVAEFLKDNSDIKAYETKIKELQKELESQEPVNVQDLKEEKEKYSRELDGLKSQLTAKDRIEQANKRIASLQKEESELAQKIADYERDQYLIDGFTKARIDKLEAKINDRFQMVKFKLFETQVNGGEVPTCKALVNGVPYADANTASKVNAGIDIINTLCDHYGVSGPVWIDNRESVSELIQSQSQIINLIVSPKDKKLRIETPELTEMF